MPHTVAMQSPRLTVAAGCLCSLARKWARSFLYSFAGVPRLGTECEPPSPAIAASPEYDGCEDVFCHPPLPAPPLPAPPSQVPPPPACPVDVHPQQELQAILVTTTPLPTPSLRVRPHSEPRWWTHTTRMCDVTHDGYKAQAEAAAPPPQCESPSDADDDGAWMAADDARRARHQRPHDEYCECRRCTRERENEEEKRQKMDEWTLPKPKNILFSQNWRYEVLRTLGKGSYGQVLECRRVEDGVHVAMKVLSGDPLYSSQAYKEAGLLAEVRWGRLEEGRRAGRCGDEERDNHIVRILEWLRFGDRLCLVFEMLSVDLAEFMQRRDHRPLCLEEVANVTRQMLLALEALEEYGIVHADVKPENIMLVKEDTWPLHVKLIDFSCSFRDYEPQTYYYLQTRYYRAPEVILHIDLCTPVDMWSLGCVAAELLIGRPLLPGANEADMLRLMNFLTGGPPPNHLLCYSPRTEEFYKVVYLTSHATWKIKDEAELGLLERPPSRFRCLEGVHEIVEEHQRLLQVSNQPEAKDHEIKWAHSLLKQMLTMDPNRRIRPGRALCHPFISALAPKSVCTPPEQQSFGERVLAAASAAMGHGMPLQF